MTDLIKRCIAMAPFIRWRDRVHLTDRCSTSTAMSGTLSPLCGRVRYLQEVI
jgi:hypothetical protein